MRTRVCRYIQSPDANEGALAHSNYSIERTRDTELLFAAKERVALPFVRLPETKIEDENQNEGERGEEHSAQE